MHNDALGFSSLRTGRDLGELRLTVPVAANERYWRAAGIDHLSLRAGTLYPPIAANLTVLLFGAVCRDPVIQTRQHLRCHRRADAGIELVTTGRIVDAYDKRGRAYVDVDAIVTPADAPDAPLWDSSVTFTPAATFGARP